MKQVQIIPTVFSLNKTQFDKKLDILKFAPVLHIDFMDSTLTKNSSVSIENMKKIKELENIKFEIHLMTTNPLKYIDQIKRFPIRKVLMHVEIDTGVQEILEKFKSCGFLTYLVFNPDTKIDKYYNLIKKSDGVMLMGVIPGAQGQEFIEETLDKVKLLKLHCPNKDIQVDGGIKYTNFLKIAKTGANLLCVGSYVSSSENPIANYQNLNSIVKNK